MSDNEPRELSREEKRSAAWDLATRIRFLREEIREGRNATGGLEELRTKTVTLAGLYENEIPVDKAMVGFEVRDAGSAKNTSGWTFVRRVVEINNPKAKQGTEGTYLISLLPSGVTGAGLLDFGTCEVLPPAYGGI